MQAVARNIFPDEEEVVPAVLHQVLALPFTLHQAVRVTAMRLVGELSEWIDRHPETLQVHSTVRTVYVIVTNQGISAFLHNNF